MTGSEDPSGSSTVDLLLVDDDSFIADRLPRRIEALAPPELRVRIQARLDPGSALAIVDTMGSPFVLVTDLDLKSTLTGADLISRVRAKRPDATVVLMSGRPSGEVGEALAEVKPHRFLEKDLRLDDLARSIVEIVVQASEGPVSPPPPRRAREAGESPPVPTVPDRLFRRAVEAVTDYAIILLDAQGRILTWNAGAERINGWRAHEIVGKHFSAFYPPNEAANRKPQFELRVAAAEGRFADTGWRVRKDGTMFWADVIVSALRDADGSLVGFSKLTRDLTDRRHAEEALRESEERHRLLIETVRDYAIFMLDPHGRVTSWNAGAERISGYKADEIIGDHFSVFYSTEDRARGHPERELMLARQRGQYEEEGWRIRKDGSRYWAGVLITPLTDPNGSLRGFAKIVRDLSTRRAAEQALEGRTRQLSELTRELEAYNYTVAHDLRTPLRAILHLSEVLNRDHVAALDEDAREIVTAIGASATRMGELVEDLLRLARSTRGDVQRENVNISEIAREIGSAVRARENGHPVTIDVETGLEASADPRLVRVVLENLISNAVKFSRQNEEAVVRVGRGVSRGEPAFYVADNGIGFDGSDAEILFRPFTRLPTASAFEGTGIGLATVQRIVARHGGRVWAESAPGKGATFWFTLPPGPF